MFGALSNDTQGVLYLVAVILAGVGAVIAGMQRAAAVACISGAIFFVALVACLNAFQA